MAGLSYMNLTSYLAGLYKLNDRSLINKKMFHK